MPRRLHYGDSKHEFIEYLDSKNFNQRYKNCLISYLDKYVVTAISEPMDIIRIFSKLSSGQAHNLNRGIRNFLNFQELKGVDSNYLNALRKAIPQDTRGYDLNVPDESQIIESLRKLNRAPIKYKALWNLELDSGLRLTEACKLINQFESAVKIGEFYRVTLGFFRGSKVAFAGYFTKYTLKMIEQTHEELIDRNASHYYDKYDYVNPKYERKFQFDTMISEEFSVPESIADFIQGRTPKRVGAKHYSKLLRQADGHYPKFARYVTELRARAGSD